MPNQTMNQLGQDEPRAGDVAPDLRRNPALLYSTLVVLALLIALGYKLRGTGVFACSASGYDDDHYLAYCNATAYGDYDHGAFWFGLEPITTERAATADVLFLGSSRMQFGFSAPATARWFGSGKLRYYLLGFSHTETVQFVGPLLELVKPHAKLYVINIDDFFDARDTEPFRSIKTDPGAEGRYVERRRWQALHRFVCGNAPALCGDQLAFFRSRADGSWQWTGTGAFTPSSVADGPASGQYRWPEFAAIAERFIAQLHVERRCVVLTIVPYSSTKRAEATAIAELLGMELISPSLDGLHTFDGSHLDRPSAQRWSEAFFVAAKPRIDACLGGPI